MPNRPRLQRKTDLTAPGEPLIINRSPLEASIRFAAWSEATGIASEDLLVSGLVSVPLPVYPAEFPAGLRRWEGTKASAMWHPFTWLPERVAHRYTIESDDGPDRLESDDEWAVRVALETTASGLYNESSGTWMDVLASAGFDVDSDQDLAAVAAWLHGAPNPDLDRIDLTGYFLIEADAAWAVKVASGRIDDLRAIAWAHQADDLAEWCSHLIDPDDPRRHSTDIMTAVSTLATLGQATFSDITDEILPGVTERAFWEQMATLVRDRSEARETLDKIQDHLLAIRDVYHPRLLELAELG